MKYFYTFFKATFFNGDEAIIVVTKNTGKGSAGCICFHAELGESFEASQDTAAMEWLCGLVHYYELGEDPSGYVYQKLRPEPFLTNKHSFIREAARISVRNETTKD